LSAKMLSFSVLAAIVAASLLFARPSQKTAGPPDPSYREDAEWNRRHPGLDIDVSLYINHWRNAAPRVGHGGLIERDILTPGDPFHPAKKGAVLRFLKTYARAELAPGTGTRDWKDDREQVFFFIMAGSGSIAALGRTAGIEEGTAVVVPPGIACRLANPGDRPLEMLLAAEETPADFVPLKEISIGRFRDSLPLIGAHWAHVARPFAYDREPKFAHPMGFVVVSMDECDIAQPHTHPAAAEEIWLQVKGHSLLFFGNELLKQEPGEAFLVPPNNKAPHSSIRPDGEPQLWLFFGCREGA
jgi:mannose-6-phosphate isomerase-like protein (cupin superfamily)